MAGPVLLGADRVKENSSTTGTGDFTLEGATTGGFFRFQDVLAVGDFTIYVIQNTSANEVEIGVGFLTSASVLQRFAVRRSTNNNALVDFSAGTKSVFIDADSRFLAPLTAAGDLLYRGADGFPAALPISTDGFVLTLSAGLPSWQVGGSSSLPVADTQTIVKGSVDATKLMRFEVDGFTAGATRVITPADADINLPGTNIVNTWVLLQTFSTSPTAPFGSGADCERFGAGAGRDAATGASNTAFGSAALDAVTSGFRNVAIGPNAAGALTQASNVICIGSGAGDAITLGGGNICIGFSAGGTLISGTDNIFIGSQAGADATSTGNVGVGHQAGLSITSGDGHVAVGYHALNLVTTADDNTAVGDSSLENTTGGENCGFGFLAGQGNVAGVGNTWLGCLAGFNTTGSLDYTVGLGHEAEPQASNELALSPRINDVVGYGYSTTSALVPRIQLTLEDIDNTHATRKYRLIVSVWDTAQREGFRVDTDGSGANFSFFGAGSFGSGRNVVFIPNAAVDPSTDPTGGGIFYASAGALKYRGSSGTVTTLAAAEPHCPVCGADFVVEYQNDRFGYLCICLSCLARELGKRPWITRRW